jgi:hypothetical protein
MKFEYYPKFKIQEAFDFDKVGKKKKSINAYDILVADVIRKL